MKNITLAQFISETREKVGLSQKGLADRANVHISIIEALESGQDLFMSTTIRQKIAKVLKTEPRRIKELEKEPLSQNEVSLEYVEEIKLRILDGQLTGIACPLCGSELVCRVAEMRDLEDNFVKHPKARCSKCPFQIK